MLIVHPGLTPASIKTHPFSMFSEGSVQ